MDRDSNQRTDSLQVIQSQDPVIFDDRRQLSRVSVSSEQFRWSENQKLFSVSDVSLSGMGFWVFEVSDLKAFSVGRSIQGILNLQRKKYGIQARVQHKTADRVGVEFESMDPALRAAIELLWKPEMIGASLRPCPASEHHVLWYSGSLGADFRLKRASDGQFIRFSLLALGSYIQWDLHEGLSTGHALLSSQKKSDIRGVFRLETWSMQLDLHPEEKKLDFAKKILISSMLSEDLKHWCLRQLVMTRMERI